MRALASETSPRMLRNQTFSQVHAAICRCGHATRVPIAVFSRGRYSGVDGLLTGRGAQVDASSLARRDPAPISWREGYPGSLWQGDVGHWRRV